MTAATAALLVLAGCGGGGSGTVPMADGVSRDGRLTQAFLQLLSLEQQGAVDVGNTKCAGCHTSGVSGAPVFDMVSFQRSKMKGVPCERCHGPGSKHAATPTRTNILTFPWAMRHEVCAQCHDDRASEFAQSAHTVAVAEVVASAKTNATQGKTCLRCHSSALRGQMIDVPLSAGKTPDEIDAGILGLTAAQVTTLADATVESPACANCHNPHKRTGKLTWKGEEVQLRRAVQNTDTSVVGQPATPVKLVSAYDHTCASCHMGGTSTTADPSDAALERGTARPNTHEQPQFYVLTGRGGVITGTTGRTTAHLKVPGQCSHCHMPGRNHTTQPDYDNSCQPCHSSGDIRTMAAARRARAQQGLDGLKARLRQWSTAKLGDPDP